MQPFRKIVVGISGGVDSAIAAHLLKEKGFSVLGVFMKNWDEFDETGRCTGEEDLRDAEYTCNKLKIDLKQVNYVKEYWNAVFTKFLEDYEHGLTPNPDILCNRYIKFDLFHHYAIDTLKYDAIATGHYANTTFGPYLENYKDNHDVRLLIPKDTFKDQTFFLSGIKYSTLTRSMFPLATFYKTEVKDLARKLGLDRLANKKESTGICFVGSRKFKEFIKEYIESKPGNFIDIDNGQVVGSHNGLHQWTVGQRCRLASFLQPYFVADKEVDSNTIFVASGHNHPALLSKKFFINNINWLCPDPLERAATAGFRCRFRFQHTKPLTNCTIFRKTSEESNGLFVVLDEELRAITTGQYAVFYNDTECLGSGRIIKVETMQTREKIKASAENS